MKKTTKKTVKKTKDLKQTERLVEFVNQHIAYLEATKKRMENYEDLTHRCLIEVQETNRILNEPLSIYGFPASMLIYVAVAPLIGAMLGEMLYEVLYRLFA